MSRRYLITLHGTGFSVPVENDKPIRGFYTIRRVLAESAEDAKRCAITRLQEEEKFRWLVQTTERELGTRDGCAVQVDSIGELSWFRWHFTKQSPSFIFYSNEKSG